MPLHRRARHFFHVQVRESRRVLRMPQHRRPFAGQRLHQVQFYNQNRLLPYPHTLISAPLNSHRYTDEEGASKCLQALHGRFFAGVQLFPEFSPVTDFRNSRCRQVRWRVVRGGYWCFVRALRKPLCAPVCLYGMPATRLTQCNRRWQFEEGTCNRGGICDFMHIMKPSKSIFRFVL
jgi:hypothetical protein